MKFVVKQRVLSTSCRLLSTQVAKPYKEIPQPRFSLPYFGTLLHYRLGFLSINDRHSSLLQFKQRYGPIVREKIHGNEVVHLFDPEDYRLVFSQEGKVPEIVPLLESIVQYRIQQGYAPGVGNTNGDEWYDLRSAIRKLMMPPQSVANFKKAEEEVANDFVDRIAEIRNPETGLVPNLEFEVGKWNYETAANVSFNRRLNILASGPNDTPSKMLRVNAELFEKSVKLHFGILPWYKWFHTPVWSKLVKEEDFFYGEVKRLFLQALEECKREMNEGIEDEDRYRFLKYLLHRNLTLENSQIVAQSLFTDGISTTVPTTIGQLYCLASNPEKQENLFQEVSSVCDNIRDISINQLTQMAYLRCCIKECFRFFPVGLEVSRVLNRDLVLSGYLVPKGTAVEMNNFALLQDESQFVEPTKYLPERWLRNQAQEKAHPYALVPFSHGPRQCLGRRFAEQEMNLLLAKIVRRFRLEWRGDRPMKQRWRFLNIPDVPAAIAFIPR